MPDVAEPYTKQQFAKELGVRIFNPTLVITTPNTQYLPRLRQKTN